MSVTDRLNIWSNWGCIHQISRIWEKHSSIFPSTYGLERRDAIWESWVSTFVCIWDTIVSILFDQPATSKYYRTYIDIHSNERLCTLIIFTAMLPPFTNYKVQHTNYYFTLQHTPCHHGRPPWFPHVFLLNEATTDPDGVGRAKG